MGQDRIASGGDLTVIISQTAADKIVASVDYPFTVFEESVRFSHDLTPENRNLPRTYVYTPAEVEKVLEAAESAETSDLTWVAGDSTLATIAGSARGTIENARSCLRALEEQPADYQGPSKAELEEIASRGIYGIGGSRGIQFRTHLAHVNVTVTSPPTVILDGPRLSIVDLRVRLSCGAELWWQHPVLHSRRLRAQRSVRWEWSKITSVRLTDMRVDAAAMQTRMVKELSLSYAPQ